MNERWECYEPGSYAILARVGGAEILDEIIEHHELNYVGEEKLSIYLDLFQYEIEIQSSLKERIPFHKRMEYYYETKGYNFNLSH
ncbi:hypothetical protein SAMN05444162_1753 [Paenibacillaceae bacterium GAS479]|nr:hypothetical protein SAMN05444162_1753 [Paenibacillaceae bacterium GAS479]